MQNMTSANPPRLSLFKHLCVPLGIFTMVVLSVEIFGLDLWLADRIYVLPGNAWTLRNSWLTRDLIHDGGRLLAGFMAVSLLVLALASSYVTRLRSWRRGLWYLVASILVSGLAVNLLKEITHIDCPWDLLRYGGEFPYVRNFERHPGTFPYGACFPAGHASAAYAWIGVYYFAYEHAPRLKWKLTLCVLVLGLVFGIGQQLRGAHFVSHDIWTCGLCWFLSTAVYLISCGFTARQARCGVPASSENRQVD